MAEKISEIAPLNTRELRLHLDDINKNNVSITMLDLRQKRILDSHENTFVGGTIAKLREEAHITVPDDLYYMLHPKYVAGLLKKSSSSLNVMAHAINSAHSFNTGRNVPLSYYQLKNYNDYYEFIQNIGKNTEKFKNDTITFFDIETFGGGRDKYGLQQFHGIYEYNFINVDHKGQAKNISGLIGIRKNSQEDRYIEGIQQKLTSGIPLDENEKTTYTFMSRLGYSSDKITKKDGRWISTGLTNADEKVFSTDENFLKGITKLREIGSEQVKESGTLGGYKQLIDDMASIDNKIGKNTMIGHNILGLDIPFLKNVISRPEAKDYANSIGLNVYKMLSFRNSLDSYVLGQSLDTENKAALLRAEYGQGIDNINHGGGFLQSESLFKGENFGGVIDVHHNSFADDLQQARIMSLQYDDKTQTMNFAPSKFTTALNNQYKELYDNDNGIGPKIFRNISQINKKLENNEPIYILPKQAGSIQNIANNPYVYYTMQDNDKLYYSDGIQGIFDEQGKAVFEDSGRYTPSPIKRRNMYQIMPESIQEITDPTFIQKIGKERHGFQSAESIISFIVDPVVDENEKYLNKANTQTRIFLPKDYFEEYFSRNFDITQIGNEVTYSGKEVLKNLYSRDINTVTKADIESLPSQYFTGNKVRETMENASRAIIDGKYNTIEKALALRYIVDVGKLQMDDFVNSLRNLQNNFTQENVDEFMRIVSGVRLDETTSEYVTNVLGGSINSANTWRKLWMPIDKNSINSGWMDNTLYLAKIIRSDSIGAQFLSYFGGRKHSIEESSRMRFGFQTMQALYNDAFNPDDPIQAAKGAYGIHRAPNEFRFDNGTRRFNLGTFRKRYLPKRTKLDSPDILLNLNTPERVFNQIFKSIRLDPNSLTPRRQLNYINDFIDELKQNLNIGDEEFIEELNSLKADLNLNAKEKSMQLASILKKNSDIYNNLEFLPDSVSENIVASDLFTKEATKRTLNILDQTISKTKDISLSSSKEDAKQFMNEFIFNGLTERELKDNFFNALNRGNLDKKTLAERRIIFNKQIEAAKTFGDNLIEHLSRAGGKIVNDNGRLLVSFDNNLPIDISAQIPRLITNGNGTSYTRLGSTSYVTGLVGNIESTGKWNVQPLLSSINNKIFYNIDDEFKQAKLLGRRPEDVLTRRLSQGLKPLIQQAVDATSGHQANYRRNGMILAANMLYGRKERADLLKYVESLDQNDLDVQALVKELGKNVDKDLEYVPPSAQFALGNLLNKGVFSTTFTLKHDNETVDFHINPDIKDTSALKGYFGIETSFGSSSATGNLSAFSSFVDEALIDVPSFKVGKYVEPISTGEDIISSQINGIDIQNKINAQIMDINTYVKDQKIKEALARRDITQEQAQRLAALINPREGGGAISGKLLETTGYIDGRKVVNLDHKDLLEHFYRNSGQNLLKDINMSFGFDPKKKQYVIKYGRGNFVDKNSPFLKSFSQYDGSAVDIASKASNVTQMLVLGEGKDLVLSEDDANAIVQQMMKQEHFIPQSEKDFHAFVNKHLQTRLVATPIANAGTVKIKDSFAEKHEVNVVYNKIKDIDADSVRAILDNKYVKEDLKKSGVDIGSDFLREDVYMDIATGSFSNPMWSTTARKELKDLIKENGGLDTFKFLMLKHRNKLDDAMQKTFNNAQIVTETVKDSIKHKEYNKYLEYAYVNLKDKAFKNEKDAAEKAMRILSEVFDWGNTEGFAFNPDGTLRLPKGSYKYDLKKLFQTMEQYGIELPKVGETYNGSFGIAKVAQNIKNNPKLDPRTINSLMKQVYDNKVLKTVRDNMIKYGLEEDFDKTFSEILDDHYEANKDELKLKGKYQGRSVWSDDAFIDQTGGVFSNGETPYKSNSSENPEIKNRKDKIAKEAKEKYKTPLVSKEYVDAVIHSQDVQASYQIKDAIDNVDSQAYNNLIKQYGYIEKNASDTNYNYRGQKNIFMNDPDALWKHNTVIDLRAEGTNLNDAFFNKLHKYNGKLVLPAFDPTLREMDENAIESTGQEVHLKEYQKKAFRLLQTRDEIIDLNKRLGSTTNNNDKYILEKAIQDKEEAFKKNYFDFEETMNKYNTTTKEGGVLYDRMNLRSSLSNRTHAQVFDVDSWISNISQEATDFGNEFKYKGRSLRDMWKNGEKVSFTIASIDDLEKFGFNEEYFNTNGINRLKWIENVKINGIRALVHRDPNDYHGSMISTQLYFSDKLNSGMMMTDHITAAQMKLDADGDHVATYVLGTKNSKGDLIDLNSARRLNDITVSKRAKEISNIHDRSLAINTYHYRHSSNYRDMGSKNYVAAVEYNKEVKQKLNDAIGDLIDNFVMVDSRNYLDNSTREALTSDWNKAKNTIQKIAPNQINNKLSDIDYRNLIKDTINKNKSSLSEEQLNILKKGIRSHTTLITPAMVRAARIGRSIVGEMDTPFNAVDQMVQFLSSDNLNNYFGENASKFRLSDQQIQALDYLKESSKEGFLTPKKQSERVTEIDYQRIANTTRNDIDNIIRGGKKSQQSLINLRENVTKYGKNVVDRNNIEQIIGDMEYNKLVQQAAKNGSNLDDLLHAAAVNKAVSTLEEIMPKFSKEFRDGGVFSVYSEFRAKTLEMMRSNSEELRKKAMSMMNDAGFKNLKENIEKATSNSQEKLIDIDEQTKTAKALGKPPRINNSRATEFAKEITSRRMQSGFGKKMLFFAAGVMMLGYTGGNPGNPTGREAGEVQIATPQNYVSPIPPQTPSSLISMRQGSKQGYIININAQSQQNNDYIGQAISKAVRQNYNNAQVNINVKTQEQNDITYDQVYNYMEQAFLN